VPIRTVRVSPLHRCLTHHLTSGGHGHECSYACCPDGNCAVNETSGTLPPVCTNRRSGILCSWCDEGYTVWAGECVPCKGVNWGMLVLSIVLVAFALVFLILRPPSKSGASAVVVDYYQLTNIISVPATSACSTSLCPLVFHA